MEFGEKNDGTTESTENTEDAERKKRMGAGRYLRAGLEIRSRYTNFTTMDTKPAKAGDNFYRAFGRISICLGR